MNLNDTLQIVFSGVVALSTVVYSILTWQLVSETRRMRQFQITPDINVFFDRGEADPSLVYIVFKNTGLGIARKVTFEIIKDFKFYDNEHFKLGDKGIFKNGLESFYSNQFIKFFFTNLPNNYEQKIKESIEIKMTYLDINKKSYSKIINLPLSELRGVTKVNPPDNYLGKISYEINELTKVLKESMKKNQPPQ